ncbi:MAG: HDOD domain-containing protein [Verrucomicrobiae bacterium]|nr:HDOD domain-containing protein [Verrucomicrobiae bacterium]
MLEMRRDDPSQETAGKLKLRDRATKEVEKDSAVPAFSMSAQRLLEVSSQENVDMGEIADIVGVDPGLASKYLRLANSSFYGGKSIANVEDALLRIGLAEVRKVAISVAVMDGTSCFRESEVVSAINVNVKIDWNMFWLHSLFVARLTDILAHVYRRTSGKEYLAGLLHDVGKLFFERHFTHEFESAMLRAIERNNGLYDAERHLFDFNHAEMGFALCEKWKLHREICRAVRFHHEPNSPFNKDPVDPDFQHFLAICICVADDLANLCRANIQGGQNVEGMEFETLPGWKLLQDYTPRGELDLDPMAELERTQETLKVMLGGGPPKQD